MAASNMQPLKKAKAAKHSKENLPPLKKYEDKHFIDSTKPVWNYSLFAEEDIINFKNGTLYNAYEKFGSHAIEVLNKKGFYFAVWAPNATAVSVIGDFNGWKKQLHPLFVRLDKSGIWEGFIPGFKKGEPYKYFIKGYKGVELKKGDPYAGYWELRPGTASVSWDTKPEWTDTGWMKKRKKNNALTSPCSIYEVHLEA